MTTTLDPPGPAPGVAGVLVAPDGRILVGGTAGDSAGRPAFVLTRHLPDGRVDASFGDGGRVVLQLGHDTDASHLAASYLRAIALEPDGGVVMAGSADLGVAAARVDVTGRTLWAAVHQVGRPGASGGFQEMNSSGGGLLRQSDGRLVIAGLASSGNSVQRNALLVRLDGDTGALDRSFGDGGAVIAPRDPSTESCAGDMSYSGLLQLTGGTIVAGGAVGCGLRGQSTVAVLRAYTPAGVAIPGFASGPLGLTSIGGLRAGPGSTMLAVGLAPNVGYGQPALARYTAAGALDTAFAAPNGFAAVPLVAGLEVQGDGRLVSAGSGTVLRLLADGTLDESFGRGGSAATGIAYPAGVALQPDGRILVAGRRDGDTQHPEPRLTLVRLLGGTRAGTVRIGARARVRRRAALVAIACAAPRGAAPCQGRVKLTSIVRRRGEHRIGLGRSAPFAIAPGATASIRVPLTRTARRRLVRAPRLRLVVRVTAAARQRRVPITATRAALR